MKVYFVISVAFPSFSATAKRIMNYAKGLREAGVNTLVLTLSAKGNEGCDEGVDYRHIGLSHGKSFCSILRAAIHNLSEVVSFLKDNVREEKDVVFVHTANVLDILIPLLAGKRFKYVLEMNEIPFYSNSLHSKLLRWFFFNFGLKRYSGVVTISSALSDLVQEYVSNTAKVVKLPIIVDVDTYSSSLKVESPNKQPYILHSGTQSEEKDGFIGMVKALSYVKSHYGVAIELFCTGQEPQVNEYKNFIDSSNYKEHVHFLGFIGLSDLVVWQKNSLMFILNKYDTFQNRYCFATKLGEYLACGKAVVTTSVGEASKYLTNGDSAMIVPPGDVEAMAEKIYCLYKDEELRNKIGAQGKQVACEQFNYILNGARLKSFLFKIL